MTALTTRRAISVGLVLGVIGGLLGPLNPAAAASSDVVITELMYNPVSEVDGDEFLELANVGNTPIDLSGWSFSGITLTFAAGTILPAGGYLVISPDPARTRQTYGVTAAAAYTGKLSNSGETITLKDGGGSQVDSVTFGDRAPWPVTPDGLGTSLELIDPSLNHDDAYNWAASTSSGGHTAGRRNSVAAAGLGPRIADLTATPVKPTAGQQVTVTATITNVTSARVVYRADFAAEQTQVMTAAGGDTFTATLPGVGAGHLLRYRVVADNANHTSVSPRADDTIVYQGVVAASGVTSDLPVLEWFIADSDYNAIVNNPTADISRGAVLAYDGNVMDNAVVNIRGAASQTTAKPNWKFELPKGHELAIPGHLADPVDEFAMQGDFSDKSHGRPLLSWDAYQTAGVVNTQVFPVRTQKNGQFLGLYTYVDLFDGTWRDREGYDGDQFFKSETGAFSSRAIDVRFEKKNPPDNDFAPLSAFLAGVKLSGNSRRDFLLANADLPELINYAAVTAIIQHVDSSSKNFYLAQDPDTLRWSIVPWDLDHTFGNTCCQVTSKFVTPAEPGDKTNDLMVALLAVPEWRDMYFRRLKTLVGEVLAPGRLENVYDAKVGPAAATAALDFPAWPSGKSLTFSGQRSSLFAAINSRRSVFASDSRLPGAQSPAPLVVVNEIQHSPLAGSAAEFVELYNPSASESVDLSGWTLTGATDLQIPPGTVILPHATMTFVGDDVTFRSTYGSKVFVGGILDGSLSSTGTLTLQRADGSLSDTVTYGGAGWPSATAGPSLELLNPSGDHNDPANWALSVTTGGTPGAPNQSGGSGGGGDSTAPNTVITSPSAGATVAAGSVSMSGTASDDTDVARVDVTLQNTSTGQWLQPNGTFSATASAVQSTLVNDLGASSGWQLSASLVDGSYALTATAVDASGNADLSPASRSFSVGTQPPPPPPPPGPDTVPPNGTITSPANNQVLSSGIVTLTGLTTDNQAVSRVRLAIQNRDTKKWLRSDGSLGAWMYLEASISGSGTSAVWTYVTPSLPAGRYKANVIAMDAVGLQDPTKASVNFTIQ